MTPTTYCVRVDAPNCKRTDHFKSPNKALAHFFAACDRIQVIDNPSLDEEELQRLETGEKVWRYHNLTFIEIWKK